MDLLKLDQIVQAARVDRSTVRYVLQSPQHVTGMPEGGSPGRHRHFTVQQAMKLAVCAHLQVAGIRLTHVGQVWQFWEHELGTQVLPPQQAQGNQAPWVVMIHDSIYLKVDCGGTRTIPPGTGWYHIPSGTVPRVRRKPIATYSLNLSSLRHELDWATLPVGSKGSQA